MEVKAHTCRSLAARTADAPQGLALRRAIGVGLTLLLFPRPVPKEGNSFYCPERCSHLDFFFWLHLVGSYFPDQGLNPCPRQ